MSTLQEGTVLRREELYDMVWAEPVRTVAQRHQVSDVALAKACRRLGVPLPPRGYWAKIAAGQALKRPPLPPRKADEQTEYHLERHRQPLVGTPVEPPPPPPPLEAVLPQVEIKVRADLSSPHPLVRQALQEFRRRRKELHYIPNGIIEMARPLEVRVSPETHERAFRILDAIIRALSASGHKVQPTESYEVRSHVVIDGEKIQFRIKEGLRRAARHPEDTLASYFRPSGELRFLLWYEEPYKHQQEWRDDKRGRLDARLNEIFAGFFQAAAERKRVRAEWVEAQRRQVEEQQRAWTREEERRREQERIKLFRTAAHDWEEARLLRAYVDELETRAQRAGTASVYGRPLSEWTRWARRVAIDLDSLRGIAELEADCLKPQAPEPGSAEPDA